MLQCLVNSCSHHLLRTTDEELAVLFDLARAVNQAGDSGISFLEAKKVLSELAEDALGLKLEPINYIEFRRDAAISMRLVQERNSLRKAKRWQEADEIRNKLLDMNVIFEDTAEGTKIIGKRKG